MYTPAAGRESVGRCGLRCAEHPYSHPFTSHQASLVPTGFQRCCSPDRSSGRRRRPDWPTGGGAWPAGRCERPGGRGVAGRRAAGGASVVAPRPRGCLGGSRCTGAGAHLWLCWKVCMVCVVISYHYLTSTTLKQRWEGAWGSATLKPFQPSKKPRCETQSKRETRQRESQRTNKKRQREERGYAV